MRTHAYRVEPKGGAADFEALVRTIHARSLEGRYFPGDGGAIRLEDMEQRGDFLLLNFAGARSGHGPGRMGRGKPMAEFDLDDDEQFGEDTAVAYHIPTKYAAVQYNHYGPRARAIELYLNAADLAVGGGLASYSLAICLRGDAFARLQGLGFIQEVDFTVAIPGVLPGAAADGISVGGALRACQTA